MPGYFFPCWTPHANIHIVELMTAPLKINTNNPQNEMEMPSYYLRVLFILFYKYARINQLAKEISWLPSLETKALEWRRNFERSTTLFVRGIIIGKPITNVDPCNLGDVLAAWTAFFTTYSSLLPAILQPVRFPFIIHSSSSHNIWYGLL